MSVGEPTDLDNLQVDYGPKSGRPAWPVLLVVNVSLVLGLAVLAGIYLESGNSEDSKSSLNGMSWSDVLAAEQSVEMALQQAQPASFANEGPSGLGQPHGQCRDGFGTVLGRNGD